ncbi:hypothetical protein ASE01_09315 [Nocardioides sp. Root190]|uniref:hypothetical protein n=1 Tax=Nocardioides sp. Root190 TaxID=1736488 RepID=UPI0006F82D83|nr:hypothetical protein [Nocardioides sp. Root190]KRB76958.1 hypothetical protein ASE01_09315 [Nocardioides sp. Root190]
MAVTLDVPFEVLRTAKIKWDEAADELDGNWRRLHKSSIAGFSAEVTAAVEAFREPWVDEIKVAGERAQAHSDEIVLFGQRVWLADADQAERVRALLPWAHSDAGIAGQP